MRAPGEQPVQAGLVHGGWDAGEAVVTTVLDERDGRTTMTTTVRHPSREVRDSVLRTPMERGAGEAYDRLAELLDEMTKGASR
ncbi:SRPBCC domain-containing protein [Sphaerisporangium dianthi]|uniref:SRPBCC domain-containing protein n=1 Tax=Sphaerisporangium dianthi TaxID=1436120 RepID=A0ABV9CAN4_9ACTN